MKTHWISIPAAMVLVCAPNFATGAEPVGEVTAEPAPAESTQVEEPAGLITANSAGAIKLEMTIADAQAAMAGAKFERSTAGEGDALVSVVVDGVLLMTLSTGEENTDAPLEGKASISFIEVTGSVLKTAAGVHVGMALDEAEKQYGKVKELVLSELEAREYVTFSNQPSGLYFRLSNDSGSAGIYKAGDMVTGNFRPGSKISAIEVSGADIMQDGRIAGIALDTPEAGVLAITEKAKLGEPVKGEDKIWEAFGEAVQSWRFKDSGLSLDMISGEIGGAKAVFSITLEAPSEFKTENDIGIGSSKEEVIKAYEEYKTEREEAEHLATGGDMVLVGSIYGGMVFTFIEGKVSRIFLGASAE